MCQICFDEPGSHSFYLLKTEENVNVYYTCPAEATKYWDTQGILQHYEEVLTLNGQNPWVWIFDSQDFGINHSMQINVALGIVRMLKAKYGQYLQEIRIVNPTIYIRTFYAVLEPFLSKELIEMIKWEI